jgi:hypothetical protein
VPDNWALDTQSVNTDAGKSGSSAVYHGHLLNAVAGKSKFWHRYLPAGSIDLADFAGNFPGSNGNLGSYFWCSQLLHLAGITLFY